jgi:hypothetical protein
LSIPLGRWSNIYFNLKKPPFIWSLKQQSKLGLTN